ncbi:MAG: type II toxin-antitoxin system Phd/YefM family antitoxin [Luteitalea sp.]|nr:type II toxin-antitoxin system Phd/YefM family antitoxin [Luteitalea sp.]
MAISYTVGEAKTQLSKLIREAEKGREVVLRRGRRPVARLVAITAAQETKRRPGRMKGRVQIAADFDEWPEDVARALGIVD